MKHMKMAALMFGVALGVGTLAANAQAQNRDNYGAQDSPQIFLTQWGSYNSGHHDHGYRDGSDAGGKDARKGKGFIPYEHGSYRDSHDRSYRDGYVRGYREAYDQNARYRDPRYGSHNDSWRDSDHDRDDHWRDRDDYYRDHDSH
jgi:hypothetical protein